MMDVKEPADTDPVLVSGESGPYCFNVGFWKIGRGKEFHICAGIAETGGKKRFMVCPGNMCSDVGRIGAVMVSVDEGGFLT